jgi:acetyltransferase-like isoleucine patch superfamily enzyme
MFILQLTRSLYASYRLAGNPLLLCVRLDKNQKIQITKAKNAVVDVKGIIDVANWGGLSAQASISISDSATFIVSGNISLGPGVHISVGPKAMLSFGGVSTSTGSGITCNSRISAEQSINIGKDCIFAWDIYITDSDHHDIEGKPRCSPVIIEDNVWVSHGVSILKGAHIPKGCIVGAKSIVSRGKFEENSLIGGVPSKTLKKNIIWKR